MSGKRRALLIGLGILILGLLARGVVSWQETNILINASAAALRALTWAARAVLVLGAGISGVFLGLFLAQKRREAAEKSVHRASLSMKKGRLNEKDIRAYLTGLLAEPDGRFRDQLERFEAQLDRMNSYQDRLHVMLKDNDVQDNGAAERFLDGLEQRLFASMRRAFNIITMAAPGDPGEETARRLAEVEETNGKCLDLASRLCVTVMDHVNHQKGTVDITESIEQYLEYLKEEIQV